MTEQELIAKLEKIERLFSGSSFEGERSAAQFARARLLDRLKEAKPEEQAEEYHFCLADEWSRKLFTAILRRYGVRPYRYRRQRYTTVMARVPKSFVDDVLWPEYLGLHEVLESYLSSVTERVIKNHVHQDTSDVEVMDEAKQLR